MTVQFLRAISYNFAGWDSSFRFLVPRFAFASF
jgi:hypothetical protein